MGKTLHELVSNRIGWHGNLCWWIGWKVWPFKCFPCVRQWATRQWVKSRAKRHEDAARMLLESGWHGGYCHLDGKPYTLKVYEGHQGGVK
jgi:hypothetical protein